MAWCEKGLLCDAHSLDLSKIKLVPLPHYAFLLLTNIIKFASENEKKKKTVTKYYSMSEGTWKGVFFFSSVGLIFRPVFVQ